MKVSDFAANLVKAIEQLNRDRERDALLSTRDGVALVKLRVINKGERADGSQFSDYSKNPLPTFFFGSGYGKNGLKNLPFDRQKAVDKMVAANKKANKNKAAADKLGPSYYDWRQTTGRVVTFKNFSFTNDMWASIREFVKAKTKAAVSVEVRSSYKFYNDKIIPAHSRREKINILLLASNERDLVFKAFSQRRLQVFRDNNLIK